jgi:thioredoxin 1
MLSRKIFSFALFLIAFTSCNMSGQKYQTLKADEFAKKVQEKDVQLVDVRTPEEYAERHLKDAVNINFEGDDFVDMISKLDKSKPVLVYCLSGGRSAKASALISKKGFTQVYNLDGGILAWTQAGQPIESGAGGANDKKGLTLKDYLQKVNADKLVLVDFNAVWCGPCKQLKPILDKIADKEKDKMILMPIDVDQNPILADEMHIQNIPLMILYKNGKEVWRQLGLASEDEVEKAITSNGKP